MKLNSKYFDSIRVKPARERTAPVADEVPCCQAKGCREPGSFRAPMGRGKDGLYYAFCMEHVRQYNSTYNHFAGMSDVDIEKFQKDAITGHRPTWKTGANAWQSGEDERGTEPAARKPKMSRFERYASSFAAKDPHHIFKEDATGRKPEAEARASRPLRTVERKALESMHLDLGASRSDIKSRFKELVKLHHPDLNGGDKRSEDKLREIIQAYNYLKQAGLV